MTVPAHGYGWLPDLPDKRDHPYRLRAAALATSVDMRSVMPSIYDQGDLGSCTSNAICAALEFDHVRQNLGDFMPSRLFHYYNERVMERTVHSDAGASIRDGMKSIAKTGVCHESLWPYDTSKFDAKPPTKCYTAAKLDRSLVYNRVGQNQLQLKGALTDSYPFIIGFTVYESFETATVASTGIVPMPDPSEAVLGGHAVLVVGYNDTHFIVRNSWGTAWGDKGYFYMPFAYLYDPELSGDFWIMKTVK